MRAINVKYFAESAWLPDQQERSWWRRQSHHGAKMNPQKTALDAYLARTAAIHAKLERLQQLAGPLRPRPRCHPLGPRRRPRAGGNRAGRVAGDLRQRQRMTTHLNHLEMIMTAIQLTATQTTTLNAAADRPDGNIEPLPAPRAAAPGPKSSKGCLPEASLLTTVMPTG